MKINGSPIALEVQIIKIPRGDAFLELRVSALSIGVRRDYDMLYPRPRPPITTTVVKGTPQETQNWNDPAFQSELEERAHLENIYMFWRVLHHDPAISFDNTPTSLQALRALSKEIGDSGFSEGDMLLVLKAAMRASNINTDELEAAKKNF